MARSITEIYSDLVADKQSRPELDALTSTSAVAIWRLWLYVVATAMHVHEQLWDVFKTEVEDIAARAVAGSLRWYADRAKEFQYGYNLLFDPTTYQYSYLDTESEEAVESKIIAQMSAQEVFTSSFTGVRIKVAKEVDGVLEPLASEELEAFTTYMGRLRFAGVAMDIVSLPADNVRGALRVFYDGTLPESQIKERVETAINRYLRAIPFDGLLNRNDLIEALRSTSGVIDVTVLSVAAKPSASGSWSEVVRAYSPASGHYILGAFGTNPLTDMVIEYIRE